ncbi:hypothetical protein [Anaeromicrobium sediminis]|uniref:Uncharacterized protein n=1 Tax=Anaeromicrobium sediminis TaxID=1478221 RepID=A0A267MQE8_9FIRM|nr:hypothetical protein [Anaeromicrobium sediminis]PAB61135.1 hypothetical protein CCE28_01545 [Anaeromicrobium sediminis]
MFSYYDGYEIDGSDTSYNILTPEMEKLKEVVNYYLQLKIIRKDVPIKITKVNTKRKGKLCNKSYYKHELDLMWEDILSSSIKSFEISYEYVNPYNLYPEVKRELITSIVNNSDIKEKDLIQPVFWPNPYTQGYMQLFLEPDVAKKKYTNFNEICRDDYCNRQQDNPIRFVDVYCCLGGPNVLKYYALKKMSLAFPELEIDAEANLGNVSWYEIHPENFLYEEIDCPSKDLYMTIDRILNLEGVETSRKNPFINTYHCNEIEKYKQFRYESISYKEKEPKVLGQVDTELECLMGLCEKYHDKTLRGHIEFAKQIAPLGFVTDEVFNSCISVELKIYKPISESINYGKIYFMRKNNDIQLKLLVPQKIRSYVEQILW